MASILISLVPPTPRSESVNDPAIHRRGSSLGSSYSTISSLLSQRSDSSLSSDIDYFSDESVGYDDEASIDIEHDKSMFHFSTRMRI